jgi:hypothetical protein
MRKKLKKEVSNRWKHGGTKAGSVKQREAWEN